MRTVSVRIEDLKSISIPIGYVGENLHTRVMIDAAKIFAMYPDAVAAMTVRQPYGDAYPAVVTRDGDTVVWDVSDSDLTHEGVGEIQLAFTVGDVVAHSCVGAIRVARSIVPTGDIPDPIDDWLTRAGALLDELEGITASAETLEAGSSATAEITDVGGHKNVALGIPRGPQGLPGPDGFSPTATVTKSGDTATITITDKNGTTTANVSDGQNGQDGVTPNVTAGTTTTGEAGTNASVTRRSGSPDSAPIFDFVIPKGDKGDPGEVTEAELSDVKSAIRYIVPVTITGKYINSNGTIGESGTRYITDYIPCVPGATVYYKGETNRTDISALTFYNASKSPIEMHCNDGAINTLYSTTAPANTAYMVLSWSTTASGAVSADGTVFSVINSIFNKLDSIDSEFDAADTRMDGIDDDIEAVENVISADEDKVFGQRKAIDDLAEILRNEETVSFTSEGKYYAISAPYTAISNSNFKLVEISVTEGELYNISCKLIATDAVAGIMAYKDSSHFFGYELQGTTGTVVTVTDYPYIVPKGVTLLRINAMTDNPVIKKLTGDKNSLLWRIPLKNFVNAAYFNTSTNKYVTYTSQTTTYGIYMPVKLLGTETKIHIRTNAVNTVVAKIAFLNSATPSTGSIVSLWTNQAVGEFDVPIPSGATHVCIANDCNTSGVMLGNPEASFILSEVYDSIAKNESDIAEMKLSSFDSLVYTDRFNTQRRDSLANTMAKLKAGTLKYTILGDSITDTWDGHNQAGGGASDAAHGYAKIAYRWLKDKYGNNISFTNNGTGGITVTGTMEVVDTYIEDQGFDLCIVELGTNDWNVQTSISTFKTNYKALLDTILAYDNPPEIAIIGLGYFGDWHSERAIKEKQYNDALREIAVEYDVPFIDPYDGMKEEIDFGTYTFADITYTLDPVHPNDIGHRIWANELYKMFVGLMG